MIRNRTFQLQPHRPSVEANPLDRVYAALNERKTSGTPLPPGENKFLTEWLLKTRLDEFAIDHAKASGVVEHLHVPRSDFGASAPGDARAPGLMFVALVYRNGSHSGNLYIVAQ